MANKLLAPSYKTDYAGGQGGGISNYEDYPEDHDGNYALIAAAVNSLIDQTRGVLGQNTVIPLDLIKSTSPAVNNGFIGEHSYLATLGGSPNVDEITIDAGSFYLDTTGRVFQTAPVVLTAVGLSVGTVYVNMNTSGIPSITDSAAAEAIDLWSASWDGTDLTVLTRLESVMPDADDFQDCLSVVGNATAGIPSQAHNMIANRLENIERKLRGLQGASSNIISGATNLGPFAIGGTSAGAPGLILSDGAGTYDATSGLFRPAANVLGATISGTEVWRTLAAAFHVVTGSVALPPIAGTGDPDTWVRFPGSNILQLIANATVGLLINASGQRTSATQGRYAATETTMAHAHTDNGNWQAIAVTVAEEEYDIGGYHTGTTATHIVPSADYAGNYSIKAWVRFESGAAGIRGIRILHEGVVIAESSRGAASTGTSSSSCSTDIDFASLDEIVVEVFQNASASETYDYRITFRKEE